jgi:hypothetical protein
MGNCSRSSVGFTPLADLGLGLYHRFQGGLYPGGRNSPPNWYLRAGLTAAAGVRPLAANGAPSGSGRVVLLSIGMSNAYDEFLRFIQLAGPNPDRVGQHLSAGPVVRGNRHVTLVNGAVPSFDANKVLNNKAAYLGIVENTLASAGVTAQQVQAVWLKETLARDNEPFPAYAEHLSRELDAIIAMLTDRFPNLRLIYISSRIYAGYAVSTLNPEPYAYETGFAVKWTVADRMAHPRARPWVGWGPYLWADGTRKRRDGLMWTCADFGPDGTHPSVLGAGKVARMLLRFFMTDPTARTWFDRAGA